MCTILALHRVRADVPLIVAANRDEFYARTATGPQVLAEGIVGGRDEQAKGTWLGVSKKGLVVAVTNQRTYAPPDPSRHSRGELVLEALHQGDVDGIDRLLRSLDARRYNPFNLLYGDGRALHVAYARDEPLITIEAFEPGVVVLANDRVGAPEYPKTRRAEALIAPLLDAPLPALREGLHAVLRDHEKPPLEAIPIPETRPAFGGSAIFTHELLRELQALCIHTAAYGTRSSSMVMLREGEVLSYEHAEGAPCTSPFVDFTSLVR